MLKNGQLVALATAFSNNGYQGDHYCYTEGEEPVTDLPSSFFEWEDAQRSDLTQEEWIEILNGWEGQYCSVDYTSLRNYLISDQN